MKNSFLQSFDLKPLEGSIYQTLLSSGALGATELAQKANISRTSVYDVLKKLIEKGLVIEIQEIDKKIFDIQPLEKVALLLKEKESALFEAQKMVESLKNSRVKDIAEQPQMLVFRGKKQLQEMMKDVYLYPGATMYSYSPPQKIFQSLGSHFMDEFHKKRIVNNIPIKVIWPKSQLDILKKHSFLAPGRDKKREARSLDAPSVFPLAYIVYANNVMFLSSKKEDFGFIVRSRDLAETMRGQFDILWGISKDL